MLPRKLNLRLFIVALLAVSVSLPIAALSIAKVLLFLAALFSLFNRLFSSTEESNVTQCKSCQIILVCIGVWAASLSWTGAAQEDALVAFAKHGKLLIIPILIFLVRSRQEAKVGLVALLSAQCVVMCTSWFMALNVSLPWVVRPSGLSDPLTQFVPYADSYLDQSIMLAGTSGIAWHMARSSLPFVRNTLLRLLGIGCLLNVVVLMPGRTGYILAIAAVSMAAVFEVPVRCRLVASIFAPIVLGIVLYQGVPQFQNRVQLALQEWKNYGVDPVVGSSVGARLNMWKLSVTAIAQQPLVGHGVGNWTPVIKKLYGTNAEFLFGSGNLSNPHQEILLWTVELGSLGAALFAALLFALIRDTRTFQLPIRRASLSLVTMLLITCLFNSSLYDDLMGDYFCIALGLLLSVGFREYQEQSTARVGYKVTD